MRPQATLRHFLVLTGILLLSSFSTHAFAQGKAGELSMGPLKRNMELADALQILGPPESTTSVVEDDEGYLFQTYNYYGKGVSLVIVSETSDLWMVDAIYLFEPCPWQAPGGLKVGMAEKDAEAILRGMLGEGVTWSARDLGVIIHHAYCLLKIACREGKVTHVVLEPIPTSSSGRATP